MSPSRTGAAEKGDKSAAERIIARRDAAITVTAVAAGGYALAYGGYILVAGSAEMAAAGRIALEGCKTNPALCLNNVGIFVADAIAPEAAVGTGVLATGAVKVLGNTQEGAKNLAGELSHASKPLLSNAKPDTHAVTRLIEKEKLYIERNSATATEAAAVKTETVAVNTAKSVTKGTKSTINESVRINASNLKLTKTVENHLIDINKAGDRVRPYGNSRALIQEIMDSKLPSTDPRGVLGALRWDVLGMMNGSKGTYELVVDPNTNTVLHFLFKSGQ
ncbi:hypothetical protein [Photorhabdus temperata]|uniref:Uncharacterized protein n=1 Tax=Photorhabdus temperata subsp. temperata Meg1 TaxID=1393735 RepID=A0A081RQN8_PHOTE|nr:hypothetical protein [Photorhabdus temperata]KER00991.1 hypothetical protein MEG1DRAFT_04416 [Photorhabdus temperata subsp. temperata Meg1]